MHATLADYNMTRDQLRIAAICDEAAANTLQCAHELAKRGHMIAAYAVMRRRLRIIKERING